MGQDVEELRHDIERSRGNVSDTLDAIGDRVSPGRMITRRRNRMSQGVQSLKDRIMGTASGGAGAVSDTASGVVDHVRPDAIREQAQGSPLGAGAVAFGIGFVVAAALPRTEAEAGAAETLKEKAQPITGQLADAGREVAADLKEGAVEKGQELKEAVSEAAGEVKGSVQQEAGAAKDDVTTAAEEAVEQRRSGAS